MITKTNAYYIKLTGSNYEIGKTLGQMVKGVPGLVEAYRDSRNVFSSGEMTEVLRMFNEFCPGVNEEIAGFSDEVKIPVEQVIYYSWTYLKPGCSQMAVLPSKTSDNHILLARNYDMSEQMDEMRLCITRAEGRYAHIGSSIMSFGRGDGMNECGLAVSQTSVGMPVGAVPPFRKPKILGLQFWSVIRSILEQCKTVDEALNLVKEIPISYNMNLLLADKEGTAALVETLDGYRAVKRIDSGTHEQFLCSTNHAVMQEIKEYEPMSMRNSIIRYELINRTLENTSSIKKEDLKSLLSKEYPQGLSCSYYEDFFGTLRSMIFDPVTETIDVRFGSPYLNDWHSFNFSGTIESNIYKVKLKKEGCTPDFFEFI